MRVVVVVVVGRRLPEPTVFLPGPVRADWVGVGEVNRPVQPVVTHKPFTVAVVVVTVVMVGERSMVVVVVVALQVVFPFLQATVEARVLRPDPHRVAAVRLTARVPVAR